MIAAVLGIAEMVGEGAAAGGLFGDLMALGAALGFAGFTVALRRSRSVTLVAQSGSGKKTLARVITGLLPPLEGKIIYDGTELPPVLKSHGREIRRQLQMIYQMPDTAVNPREEVLAPQRRGCPKLMP